MKFRLFVILLACLPMLGGCRDESTGNTEKPSVQSHRQANGPDAAIGATDTTSRSIEQYAVDFLRNLWSVSLESAPWLLLGLIVSGMIKVWLPPNLLQRWLGGDGLRPIFNAAVLGTPLPLCSCSVIPAAITLRRSGASKGATVSFLVATPENGADSIALSYALLGPFMTLVRPIGAIFNAMTAGIITRWLDDGSDPISSCDKTDHPLQSTCCSSSSACSPQASSTPEKQTLRTKLTEAWRYTMDDLMGDIAIWLSLGLILAAVINTLVSPGAMAQWGSGLPAMGAMLVVGVPMYICATASTPVAAVMLVAGVSPGTTLVFLLAGPATNFGTIGVVRQELGNRACAAYLVGVCGGAVLGGLLVDWMVGAFGIAVAAQATDHVDFVPTWISMGSLMMLVAMGVLHFYKRSHTRHSHHSTTCC